MVGKLAFLTYDGTLFKRRGMNEKERIVINT